jgi:hypothetical protein
MIPVGPWFSKMVSNHLIGAVRVYQYTLSPLLGPCCRYYPSCSRYFVMAVQKHGPFKGAAMGIARVCRCHPWHPGGVDFP